MQILIEEPEKILGERNALLIKNGSSLARDPNTKHKINLEDEYGLLDNGEREFCLEKSVSPKDYYNVKRVILKELVFDPKYSLNALKSKCQGIT